MTADTALAATKFRVGHRTVTLTIPQPKMGGVVTMVVEWSPDTPRRLSTKEFRQYRAGRDKALADLSRRLGTTAAVVEL